MCRVGKKTSLSSGVSCDLRSRLWGHAQAPPYEGAQHEAPGQRLVLPCEQPFAFSVLR